jgi:hypothetical protein
MRKPRFTGEQIIAALKERAAGTQGDPPQADCRRLGSGAGLRSK